MGIPEATTVVVVGAGAAGLTLANLLRQRDVPCIVLERHPRAYVEQRQRAGVVEYRMAQILRDRGLGEVLDGARLDGSMEFRIDGRSRILPLGQFTGGRSAPALPQQLLVRRLIASLLEAGGDLRFDVSDVTLHNLDGGTPTVTYLDESGEHEMQTRWVAGCDGSHGISRRSIPDGAVVEHVNDPQLGWITILADAPPPRHPLFVVSSKGFAAGFSRGPDAARYYLQTVRSGAVDDWPDQLVWHELRARTGDPDLPSGPITEKNKVDMRSFVLEPMSYGRLFLAGDAAHVVAPLGGKGMNLALHDAHVLADALVAASGGDTRPLASYSATCLRRIWGYQEFSLWLSDMLHNAGRPPQPFLRQIARARLERLFTSKAAAAAFAELQVGLT